MSSPEQQQALARSTVWIARRIDLSYLPDGDLLQIIAHQPRTVWQGSARALAARWEAQRRGLIAADPQSDEVPARTQPAAPAASSRPRRYVASSEAD